MVPVGMHWYNILQHSHCVSIYSLVALQNCINSKCNTIHTKLITLVRCVSNMLLLYMLLANVASAHSYIHE